MQQTATAASYTVRIHPYSRIPKQGDFGFLLRVEGSSQHLFSFSPARRSGLPVLSGHADPVLGLSVSPDGAVQVIEVGDDVLKVRPLSGPEIVSLIERS